MVREQAFWFPVSLLQAESQNITEREKRETCCEE
jgi:hypothetical protein